MRGHSTPAESGSDDVTDLVRAVERRFGLRLHLGFHTVLAERAFKLVGQHGASSLADVIRALKDGDDDHALVVAMGQAASIGETYFFRGPKQLKLMEKLVVQQAVAKRSRAQKVLRLWSAACATGEEPYTLGFIFSRALPEFRLQILATDMNASALELAREGVYRKRSFRGVDPSTLPYLKQRGDVWEVERELRQKVTFHELNLVNDPVPDVLRGLNNFDLILCRNVLIYVDAAEIPGVMRKLSDAAASRALVVLTPAEANAGRHLSGFEPSGEGMWVREGADRASPRPPEPPKRPSVPLPPPVTRAAPEPAQQARVQEKSSLDAGEALRRARAAADKAELAEALRLAEIASGLQPSAPEPCYLIAAVSAAAGEKERAQREFERALFLDRSFAAAELGLGELLAKEGRRDEAHKHLTRAQRLLSKRPPDEVVPGLQLPVALALRLVEGALAEGGWRVSTVVGNPRLLDIPPEELELLRERAREVAKRPESAELADGVEVLEVHSRGQNYALPLSAISSITELTSIAAIPRAPAAVRGLVSVRGEVLLGVEMALLTGGGASGIADLRRVVVVGVESTRIAILAERIISVRQVQSSGFRADRLSQYPFVVGTDENFLSLVDPGALINFAFRLIGGGA